MVNKQHREYSNFNFNQMTSIGEEDSWWDDICDTYIWGKKGTKCQQLHSHM